MIELVPAERLERRIQSVELGVVVLEDGRVWVGKIVKLRPTVVRLRGTVRRIVIMRRCRLFAAMTSNLRFFEAVQAWQGRRTTGAVVVPDREGLGRTFIDLRPETPPEPDIEPGAAEPPIETLEGELETAGE